MGSVKLSLSPGGKTSFNITVEKSGQCVMIARSKSA